MPELSEAEQAELERLADRFGDVEVEPRQELAGTFGPVDPMLAETLEADLATVDEDAWVAEPKFDGTRLVVEAFDDEVRAYTRRGVDRYGDAGPVQEAFDGLPADLILDGEFTYVTSGGTSEFLPIHSGATSIEERDLTPVYYAFDVLYRDGDVCDRPLPERKSILESVVTAGEHLSLAPVREGDFPAYFEDLTDAGEEGIVLKRRESRYYPGVRSSQWLKVKAVTERDAIVVGYTAGSGSRADTFGSLVLSDGEGCIGRVGTGFTEADLATLTESMTEVDDRRVSEAAAGKPYTPVEPFVVAVRYQVVTRDGKLRAPVYLGRNPEKPLADVRSVRSDG